MTEVTIYILHYKNYDSFTDRDARLLRITLSPNSDKYYRLEHLSARRAGHADMIPE